MAAYVTAYALPAAVVWGLLALLVSPLTRASGIVMVGTWAYALAFGAIEALTLPFRPLDLPWQVPARWLRGRSLPIQTLIWGSTLGPGLVTRNPYAGMWLLPALLTLDHNLLTRVTLGVLIGVAHGSARAVGVVRVQRTLRDHDPSPLMLTQWRWRVADGLLLLCGAGSLMALMPAVIAHL